MGNKSKKDMPHKPSREVPACLKSLLEIDKNVTNTFCNYLEHFLPFRSLKLHYKILEISCHGIPWFALWLAFIWIFGNSSLYQMQVNFYLGLFLDILFVALTKAYVRRRRPSANEGDMFVTVGPDVYSFPSGHASRATYIAHFFIYNFSLPVFFWPSLVVWAGAVCISRILLKRHHLLDVCAGILLGIFESCLVGYIWLSSGACAGVVSWLSDARLDGDE